MQFLCDFRPTAMWLTFNWPCKPSGSIRTRWPINVSLATNTCIPWNNQSYMAIQLFLILQGHYLSPLSIIDYLWSPLFISALALFSYTLSFSSFSGGCGHHWDLLCIPNCSEQVFRSGIRPESLRMADLLPWKTIVRWVNFYNIESHSMGTYPFVHHVYVDQDVHQWHFHLPTFDPSPKPFPFKTIKWFYIQDKHLKKYTLLTKSKFHCCLSVI